MRARDLAVPMPAVSRSTRVVEAARLLARPDLPGLIVLDDAGALGGITLDALLERVLAP